MNTAPIITRPRLLVTAAAVEAATGVALLLNPALLGQLLLGIRVTEASTLFARCFGLALIALAIACWPRPASVAAVRAMLLYNASVALYLAYIGIFLTSGLLLWPAVALHALLTLLLTRTRA